MNARPILLLAALALCACTAAPGEAEGEPTRHEAVSRVSGWRVGDEAFLDTDGDGIPDTRVDLRGSALADAGAEAGATEPSATTAPEAGPDSARPGVQGLPQPAPGDSAGESERGPGYERVSVTATGGVGGHDDGPEADLHAAGPPSAGFFFDDGDDADFKAATIGGSLFGSADPTVRSAPSADETTTWRRAAAPPNATTLRVGAGDALPLEGLQASVWIEGFRARVVLDAFYRNPHDRRLEGDFRLRLPDGASPYFFAFGGEKFGDAAPDLAARIAGDVLADRGAPPGNDAQSILDARAGSWIEPRHARVAPRDAAAAAYSDVVRRRVDPALLEWAGAGVFHARVFPLEPGALHRVVVGYELDLERADGELVHHLALPDDVERLGVAIRVAEPEGVAVAVEPAAEHAREGDHDLYAFAHPEERRFTVRVADPGALALTSPPAVDEDWFAVRFTPALPALEAAGASRAVFAVDTSLSSRPEAFGVWLALLRAILEANREELRELAVLFFGVEAHWWREGFAPNTPAVVDELLAYAESLALEGATDLGAALAEAARPRWDAGRARWDLFLLSDGAATWGEQDPHALAGALEGGGVATLFAYRTGLAGTDAGALARLARAAGGAVFAVTGPGEVAAAARAHARRPFALEGLALAGARDLLLAGRPTAVYPGQTLKLAGRGRPRSGDALELFLSRDGAAHTVRVPIAHALSSELAARAYGEVAVAQLEELGPELADEARAYASHFRVTGRTCSLVMLESEADYERYAIEARHDAALVRATEVDGLVREALARVAALFSDPRERFVAFLARVEALPGLALDFPASLRAALPRLSWRALSLSPERVECASRARDGLPTAFREALASGEPDERLVDAEVERRRAELGAGDALRALSSLVELSPGDAACARGAAFGAERLGLPAQAYHLLLRAADARPAEAAAYPALARCAAAAGRADLALCWYELALAAEWPERFGDLRGVAALEYAALLRRVRSGASTSELGDYPARRLVELERERDLGRADLVVTLEWSTERTDVDLHVVEPSGEVCHYLNPETQSGGRLTPDVTQGLGPEMYRLRSAPPGEYRVRVQYYASDPNRTALRTRALVTVHERFGARDQRITRHAIALDESGEVRDVAVVRVAR